MLVTPWHWEATNKKEGHSTHPWPQVWCFILCDQFVRQNPAFLIRARPKICRKLPREATPTTALERTIVIQQRNMKVVFDKEVDDRWFEPVVPQCGTWKSRQYYCSRNYMNQGIMCVCASAMWIMFVSKVLVYVELIAFEVHHGRRIIWYAAS